MKFPVAVAESRKEQSTINFTPSLIYLLIYNLVQTLGWTCLAIKTVVHVGDHDWNHSLYDDVKIFLNIFQTMALLEIVHAATGIVRSNVVLTGFQIMSRVILIWGVLYTVKETQNQIGFLLMLSAWCITEIIRYSYYMGALVDTVPYAIQWLRYTLFIVLYPLGVAGELMCIYTALPYVKDRAILSIGLPNFANMSFSYYYFLILAILTYFPVFPQLYLHMFSQRKKSLSGGISQIKKHD